MRCPAPALTWADAVGALGYLGGPGELPDGAAFLVCAVNERKVAVEVLTLEAGRAAPVVAFGEVIGCAEPTGEEPAAERAAGDEADAELAEGWQEHLLRLSLPQWVLRLYGLY
jgi:hypothetical protein